MNVELLIKILTIIGSLLGAIAFFQNFAKDIVSNNKEKWNRIKEIISPMEFDNFRHEVVARSVSGDSMNKLLSLIYQIREKNHDVIGFKSIFKNRIISNLESIQQQYNHLRNYIQVPYWIPVSDDNKDNSPIGYSFDKDEFFKSAYQSGKKEDFNAADKKYITHLDEAAEIAENMYKTFLKVQKLAGKETFEIVLPWKWF